MSEKDKTRIFAAVVFIVFCSAAVGLRRSAENESIGVEAIKNGYGQKVEGDHVIWVKGNP